MPGKTINDHQIRLYMQFKQIGKTQIVASAQAGFSERSAQRIDTCEFGATEKKGIGRLEKILSNGYGKVY